MYNTNAESGRARSFCIGAGERERDRGNRLRKKEGMSGNNYDDSLRITKNKKYI